MSDLSQGPGWWKASDGKWYPPESHPDYKPVAPPPPGPGQRGPVSPAAPQAASRAEVKANAKAEAARAKAMRPWFKKKRFIIPLVIVALAVGGALAGGGDDKKDSVASGGQGQDESSEGNSGVSSSSESDELDDVTITKCEPTVIGSVEISFTVVNNSSKTSNYIISVAVKDSTGARVGDGYGSTNNLLAGQTANIDGFGDVSDSAVEPISCELAEVQRYAS